jgi:hypothetical protein
VPCGGPTGCFVDRADSLICDQRGAAAGAECLPGHSTCSGGWRLDCVGGRLVQSTCGACVTDNYNLSCSHG